MLQWIIGFFESPELRRLEQENKKLNEKINGLEGIIIDLEDIIEGDYRKSVVKNLSLTQGGDLGIYDESKVRKIIK